MHRDEHKHNDQNDDARERRKKEKKEKKVKKVLKYTEKGKYDENFVEFGDSECVI